MSKYDVVGFEEITPVRFTPEQMKLIQKIVRKDSDTYDSISHFIRSATIKRMREEKMRLKL